MLKAKHGIWALGLTLAVGLSASSAHAMGGRRVDLSNNHAKISDSLVKDLECSKLAPETVLSSLQPDAFSSDKHFGAYNWGANGLGQCWSLSHSQRLFFYLARFGTQSQVTAEKTLTVLNMIRGTIPSSKNPNGQEGQTQGEMWAPLKVFETGTKNMRGYSSFDSSLSRGVDGRNFRTEIEHYQLQRFGNPLNLGMITSSREADKATNQETMNQILKNMAANRISLVRIRAEVATQHIVAVKSVEEIPGRGYRMAVYDSNYPSQDNVFTYDSAQREFFAPHIISGFGVRNAYAPIGAFVEDDSDMDAVQETLYQYYADRCIEAASKVQ